MKNHDLGPIKVQQMDGQNRKLVRFHNDAESEKGSESESLQKSFSFERTTSSVKRGWEKGSSSIKNFGRSLKSLVTRVLAEDLDSTKKKVLDPRSELVQKWNKFIVLSCFVAILVDLLFLHLPIVDGGIVCIKFEKKLAIAVTVLRTCMDTLYLVHMGLQFRTAFIAPSSGVFGSGELVIDPKMIAARYLKKDFWLDLLAVLPLPQVFVLVCIPLPKGAIADNAKDFLRMIVFPQFLPRVFRMFPLTTQMVVIAHVVNQTKYTSKLSEHLVVSNMQSLNRA